MSALKIYYEKITTYWEGSLYFVITMKWNDAKRYVYTSMPGYFKKSLHQFNQLKPKNPQHQPYKSPERMYVADDQNMKPINTSPVLYTDQVK